MKIERELSRDLHLPLSLLFTGLALLLLAFKLPSFPQNPGLLLVVTAISGMAIAYAGLAPNRNQWLIAPIIGLAATFTSALYSTTIYPVAPCGSTIISQGYPYPWIRRLILPSDSRCLLYLGQTGGLPFYGLAPSPITSYTYFVTDAVFYILLSLAVLELVAATRRFRSSPNRKEALTHHPTPATSLGKSQVDPTQKTNPLATCAFSAWVSYGCITNPYCLKCPS